MRPSTRLILIRHGESQAQVQGLVSGHNTCTGLSDRGRLQIETLVGRLRSAHEIASVDGWYTSLLQRAKETAAILQPLFPAAVLKAECSLCELHPGDAEGLTWDEMRVRYPPVGDPDNPARRRLPGMETWNEMYERVGTRLEQLAGLHEGGTVVVAGHGGTVGASFVRFGGASPAEGITLTRATRNGSITEWRREGTTWLLVRHGDSTHLPPSL